MTHPEVTLGPLASSRRVQTGWPGLDKRRRAAPITLKTIRRPRFRSQCHLGRISSKRVQCGEPIRIALSILHFVGDPNSALELAVPEQFPSTRVWAYLRVRDSSVSGSISQRWPSCGLYRQRKGTWAVGPSFKSPSFVDTPMLWVL